MITLSAFQNAFALALLSSNGVVAGAPEHMAALAVQPGFSVYRNTVMKGCVDALQANYPAVARLTGDAWFRAAAAAYARNNLPDDPALLRYGASFADFLARFEPAKALPWLTHVARLDRLWTEAHIADNDALLEPAAIARLTPAKLAAAVLYPHAAARWAWFTDAPIFSIWSRNRAVDVTEDSIWEPEWNAEGALLTRAHGAVAWLSLSAGAHAFLEQCAHGGTLAQAADAAIASEAGADLQHIMATLLRAGAFSRMSITRGKSCI